MYVFQKTNSIIKTNLIYGCLICSICDYMTFYIGTICHCAFYHYMVKPVQSLKINKKVTKKLLIRFFYQRKQQNIINIANHIQDVNWPHYLSKKCRLTTFSKFHTLIFVRCETFFLYQTFPSPHCLYLTKMSKAMNKIHNA